eukprot:2376410-Prymnesium_polylepis.1
MRHRGRQPCAQRSAHGLRTRRRWHHGLAAALGGRAQRPRRRAQARRQVSACHKHPAAHEQQRAQPSLDGGEPRKGPQVGGAPAGRGVADHGVRAAAGQRLRHHECVVVAPGGHTARRMRRRCTRGSHSSTNGTRPAIRRGGAESGEAGMKRWTQDGLGRGTLTTALRVRERLVQPTQHHPPLTPKKLYGRPRFL